MAKLRTLAIASINIQMPRPHSPQRYMDLIREVFAVKQPIRTYGETFLVLERIEVNSEEGEISGSIGKFTRIDTSSPWFDLENFSEAEDEKVNQIRIPESLRPNFKSLSFIFFAKGHKLFFEQKGYYLSVSPQQVKRLLDGLFRLEHVVSKFGAVTTTIVQSEAQLDLMLKIPLIRKVTIEYVRPNPDDLGSLEKEMEERLNEENILREVRESFAQPGKSIVLNPQSRSLAQLSLSNGKVVVEGKNAAGAPVALSSQEKPDLILERYDPDLTTESQAFFRAVRRR